MKKDLLASLRDGAPLSPQQLILLTLQLSVPGIMAQISSIIMEYIDASMVGRLGAADSAAIGLVASSTWLFNGVCNALVVGFTVQVAHSIGANDAKRARQIMHQGMVVGLAISALFALAGASVSGWLPAWLGGDISIRTNASRYFLIYALSIPAAQLTNLAGGMLQCSGNMKVPSALHVLMCFLDVFFNLLLIFPSGTVVLGGFALSGAGLGVAGAALGTALAHTVTMVLMLWFLLFRSPTLKLQGSEPLKFNPAQLRKAAQIAIPVAFESFVMSGAYVMSTRIVSPLGTVAIAAHSFSVTAESLCYMPGYGIGSAATTLIGQSIGANRKDLSVRLAWIATGLGSLCMALSGALMYAAAPAMLALLSPDPEIQALGTMVLRIEAFAEPLYGASIVASGVFRGAGDTLVPSCMSFFSMWAVRLPLSAFLAPRMGLRGVWTAMCIELCFRGCIFLARLISRRWMDPRQAHRAKSLPED